MDFTSRVHQSKPEPGQVDVFWLGQAGFLLKTENGGLIAIDPYFSDYTQRMFPEEGLGFKRLSPPPCEAADLAFDALLISHEHADHFDVDSISAMMDNGKTKVYTNRVVYEALREMDVDMGRVCLLEKNAPVQLMEGVLLTPVDCDHGELSTEALGFLLRFPGGQIYYAGDTAYTPSRLHAAIQAQPDIAILPINGAFGNLDGKTAAAYAAQLHAKVVIPCHFWTFPLHHGDPQEIIDMLPQAAPQCHLALLCQGESYRMG